MAAAAIGCLFIDHGIIAWLFAHRSTWQDNAWVFAFRQLGKAGTPIWLLLVWSCLTNHWRPTLVTIAALILVSASVCPLKGLVLRYRPGVMTPASQTAPPQEISWHERMSFPSGDTAVVFAVATTLSFLVSRLWTPALFAGAGAVGLLRVIALAHYPSDVAAGALIGTLCGLAAIRYIASRPALDQLRIPRNWRLGAGLVLILIVPFLSPFVGMRSLYSFLRVYAIPLAVLAFLCGWAARRQTRKASAIPAEATGEDVSPLTREPGHGEGSGSPVRNYVLGSPNPDSKSDLLNEPAS
jgi:undecaprenyl-diphosphatase